MEGDIKLTKSNLASKRNIKIKKSGSFIKALQRDKYLWLLVIPGLIWYAIFVYWPMYGIIIAFKDFKVFAGINKSPWVGFFWFIQFFQDHFFWRLIRNTLLLNLYSILWGFPAPIIFALLLNEVINIGYKKIAQTISYLPYFISTVVIVGMLFDFLSPSTGIVNRVIQDMGGKPINFMADARYFRTIYIGSDIWQGLGWNAIIYLAALSGIDPELYEAATVDGASRMQKIWHITIPGIMPTIVILLILSFGGMLSVGYEKIILMYNGQTYKVADVINTYVYRIGLGNGQYSFGTAVGLFQSVVNFIIIIFINWFAKKVSDISLW